MQIIIVKNSEKEFEEAVNKHLADGWKVVPNSMNIYMHKAEGYFTNERYVVFLEKSDTKKKTKKKLLQG
jgi:hypothetical protein